MKLLLALLVLATPAAAELQVVVLLHHPDDNVDIFGVRYGDGDTFSARYGHLAVRGQIQFPTFVADGVVPIVSVPDPDRPLVSTLENYTHAARSRDTASPGTLVLRADFAGDALEALMSFAPLAPIEDPQHEQPFRMMVAVVEDLIHYQPDARISNGVTDHRFTVRALADLGPVDLQGPVTRQHTFPVEPGWERSNLRIAAWVYNEPRGRFSPAEVLQSAWVGVGAGEHRQVGKAVLLEVYSATWCDPCLYGDLAAESLAVTFGGAAPAPEETTRYFRAPGDTTMAGVVAVVAVAAAAALRRRT